MLASFVPPPPEMTLPHATSDLGQVNCSHRRADSAMSATKRARYVVNGEKQHMKKCRCLKNLVLILVFVFSSFSLLHATDDPEVARWQREAGNVTIIRDDWGIAHVYGKTDADAVFGMEYAQAEDDVNRVETNYINAMGRLAETEGESRIYQALRMKLFIDPADMQKQYAESPAWLQTLMNAFADGLNFYLFKHPEVKPRVIKHFEPWMALSFTEGSIGGDIERIDLPQLEAFCAHPPSVAPVGASEVPSSRPEAAHHAAA